MEDPIEAADPTPSAPAFARARRRRLHQVLILSLWLLTLGAYANCFTGGFVLDNAPLILQDNRITAVNPDNLTRIFTQGYWLHVPQSGLYRPVTTLSFLFNYSVLGNGRNPAGYHVVNLLLHCLNVALVYALGFCLFQDFGLAFATGALWTLHPLLTESITNIVGRADLIAGAAVLGALLCYARGSKSPIGLGALTALSAIGIFAKESAAALPVLMAAYDLICHPARTPRHRRLAYVAVLSPLIVCGWIRWRVLPPALHPVLDNPLSTADFWTARLTAVKVIGKYLWLLFYPMNLSVDYSFNQIPLVSWSFNRWEDWQAIVSLGLCLLLAAAAVVCYRRGQKQIAFWIAFSAINFVPASNLLVLIGSIMAERFLYLPGIGFAACLAAGARYSAGRLGAPVLAPAAIGVMCLCFGWRTVARNTEWQDGDTLITRAAAVSPNSFKPHWALAEIYGKKGTAGLDRAIAEVERSIGIQSPIADTDKAALTYSLAGQLYFRKGKTGSEPGSWYRKSKDILLRGQAIDQLQASRFRQRELERGVKPSSVEPFGVYEMYLQLGLTELTLDEPKGAVQALQYGRAMAPSIPAFYGLLSNAYGVLGDTNRQAITLLEMVRLFPNEQQAPELLKALYSRLNLNGCRIFSGSPYAGRMETNSNCSPPREQACAAREELARLLIGAAQAKTGEALIEEAMSVLQCPPAQFDSIRQSKR